jgi:hypothetical protein
MINKLTHKILVYVSGKGQTFEVDNYHNKVLYVNHASYQDHDVFMGCHLEIFLMLYYVIHATC